MARIRTLKPEFWLNEKLSEENIEVHFAAAAVLNYSDDEGYFNANPKLFQAACFPLREMLMSPHEILMRLQSIGYLMLGTDSEGRRVGKVVKFTEHQKVQHPSKSKYNDKTITWDNLNNPHEILTSPHESLTPEQGTGNRERNNDANASFAGNEVPDESANQVSTIPDCPHQEIITLFAEMLPSAIQPRSWDGARAAALKARWREDKKRQNLAYWRKLFGYISQSPFLMGKVHDAGKRPFEISLDWIVTASNFVKIIEGRYHTGQEVVNG